MPAFTGNTIAAYCYLAGTGIAVNCQTYARKKHIDKQLKTQHNVFTFLKILTNESSW